MPLIRTICVSEGSIPVADPGVTMNQVLIVKVRSTEVNCGEVYIVGPVALPKTLQTPTSN